MQVIRGEYPKQTVLLTPLREIRPQSPSEGNDLYFEETKRAFERGYEVGEKKGYDQALSELRLLLQLLRKMAAQLLEQKKQLLSYLKPDMIAFATTVCEQILRTELRHPETLAHLIETLLDTHVLANRDEKIYVFLSEADFARLSEYFPKMRGGLLQFDVDRMIQDGNCRIEGERGLLNHDIKRELEATRAFCCEDGL